MLIPYSGIDTPYRIRSTDFALQVRRTGRPRRPLSYRCPQAGASVLRWEPFANQNLIVTEMNRSDVPDSGDHEQDNGHHEQDNAQDSDPNDDPSNGVSIALSVHRPVEDPPTLGRYLYRERQRTGTLQRVLAARSGVSQPNISAYEQGRREPSWAVFVRLIAAMGLRPVINTEPLESAADITRQLINVTSVVREVLAVVGDRSYRFEHNAAAHLLGLNVPLDVVHVSVVGDPDNLDELALRAARGGRREVTARRGGSLVPQVKFHAALASVVLEVIAAPRDSVLVGVGDFYVSVAPMEEIRVQPLL